MGEKEEKGGRAAETDKSPRKSPRLEPSGSRCPDALSPMRSDSMEEVFSSDTSSGGCSHFHANGEEMELLLVKIESLKYSASPACECCVLESFGRSAAGVSQEVPCKEQLIMVCSQCDQCLCTGVATREDKPGGHASMHADKKEHWVALWLDKSSSGYCFFCDHGIYLHGSTGESGGASLLDDESMSSEVEPGSGNAHASGSDTDERGYVIRGITNVANTCYLNAMVQCLLVLDKLRMWMLGPDAPTGSIGMALKELFVETRARNDARPLLNPRILLQSMRAFNSQYEGHAMHDSHELLLHLRDGLNEELKRHPNMLGGAPGVVVPTVLDSIFQGQLSTTLTSKCCQSDSVTHDPFYELQLPLPSKDHPAKSPAVKQLFPGIEESNSENIQTIHVGGDSHIPATELESMAMEVSPENLEIDSTEAEQICQRKHGVHGSLQAREDKGSCSELIEVPVESVASLPDNMFDVKAEEMHETSADSHSPEDTGPPPLASPVRKKNASMASDTDVELKDNAGVAYLSNQPEVDVEAKENTCTVQVTTEAHIKAKENICAVQVTTEEKGKALSSNVGYDEKVKDNNTLASIKDCFTSFFKEEVVEWRCANCSKVPDKPRATRSKDGGQMVASTDENTSFNRNQTKQSDMKACQIEQSSDSNILVVECTSSSRQPYDSDEQLQVIHTVDGITRVGVSRPEKDSASCSTENEESDHDGKAEKKVDLSSVQGSQNTSSPQDRRKQIELNIAHQMGENQNEQKDRKEYADKTVVISKLPAVLTVHLKRFDKVINTVQHKITGHVSFEENLDVGQFTDPSSEDKDNCTYGLVGVIEHIGDSTKVGHYVAYVRASRIGSQSPQLSSVSSSWFHADDKNIREVSLEEVLKREAYILFYERMERTASN